MHMHIITVYLHYYFAHLHARCSAGACRYLLRLDLHVFASGEGIGIYTVFFAFCV